MNLSITSISLLSSPEFPRVFHHTHSKYPKNVHNTTYLYSCLGSFVFGAYKFKLDRTVYLKGTSGVNLYDYD